MRSRPHHAEHTPFSRLVHLLLLVAWLLSSQGVIPALCLAAAVLDGGHEIKVRSTQPGDVAVVLSHDGREGAGPHQHDALCALVVVLAQKPAADVPDHVIAFKSVEDASRTLRLVSIQEGLPVFAAVVLHGTPDLRVEKARAPVFMRVQAPAWSPGLAIKTGRTILRC